jgi:uncharacterized cupredoxin-like copper-binding protein
MKRRRRLNPSSFGWVLAGSVLLLLIAAGSASAARSVESPVGAPKWLSFNAANQTAKLTLIAGYQSVNAEYNFDGYAYGKMVVTMAVGWRVQVVCKTDDTATVSHSCIITKGLNASTPAFPHAEIAHPVDGVAPGTTKKFTFIPTVVGKFKINCLVTGHEAAGMWDVLKVVATGSPSIAFK